MAIGFSPFTPTSLDRHPDPRTQNPKEPDKKAQKAEKDAVPEAERVDAIERTVPPVNPTR